MDLESKLTEKLLGDALPCKTRSQFRKKKVAGDIIKTISALLKQDGYTLTPDQNYVHNHICEMFELYENWKALSSYGSIDTLFMKKITGYLLKICHFWWLDNLYILNRIVQYYYKAHGDFREIIYGVIDSRPTWKTLFKWRKWLLPHTFNNTDSSSSPLVYFLTHYNHYSIVVNGRGFVDQPLLSNRWSLSPCEDCFRNAEPSKLLLLLQYGASVSGVGWTKLVEEIYCFRLLRKMVSSLWVDEWNADDHIPDIQHIILSSEYAKKKLHCGQVITRVMPQITKYRDCRNNDYVIRRLHMLSVLGYFPNVNRRFKDPCELKHLCRNSVRYVVQYISLAGLPHGLYDLGLPKRLADYLNLLED